MESEQGPTPSQVPVDAAVIEYGPLWMKFSDPEWESVSAQRGLPSRRAAHPPTPTRAQAFRRHFSALLIKADFWWCVFTMVLTIDFYIKLGILEPKLYLDHLPDVLMYGAVAGLVCFLALRRPVQYVTIRTYLLFATRAHHQLVTIGRLGTELAPPDGATFAASKLPLDTVSGTMGRLLATCVFGAMSANGYQLISTWQPASLSLNLAFSLVKNYRLCRVEVSPAYDARRRDIHAVFTRWTDRALAWALPLTAGGGPAEVAAPCAVFRLWALIVGGGLAPLVASNLLEEWCRLSFLKARGCGVLAPGLGWRAAHAAAIVFLGAKLTWEVLTVVVPLFEP